MNKKPNRDNVKPPWEQEDTPWSSKSKWLTWLRGVLRKGWNTYPIKINFLKQNRERITNPCPKKVNKFPTIWGGRCSKCKKLFPQSKLQVDHLGNQGELTELEHVTDYVQHLFWIDNSCLSLVCKDCHSIVSYSQKTGKSFEEARIDKEIIAITKLPAGELRKWLLNRGVCESDMSNAKKRREMVSKILKGGTF
jgi:hypothetical protein